MLRHIVMWTLNDPADASRFADALRSCRAIVPGMREFDVGVRTDGFEASADVVLVSSFDDEDALTAYLEHPHHRSVGIGLATMRASRSVLDFLTQPDPTGDADDSADPGDSQDTAP